MARARSRRGAAGRCAGIARWRKTPAFPTRGGRFRGRISFSGMIYAPLVMPEVITGLSLLLLFVAADIDRGFWTIAIAHTTLTMCFVAVVVRGGVGALERRRQEG